MAPVVRKYSTPPRKGCAEGARNMQKRHSKTTIRAGNSFYRLLSSVLRRCSREAVRHIAHVRRVNNKPKLCTVSYTVARAVRAFAVPVAFVL